MAAQLRDAEIETLDRDGFVVLKDILPPAEVEKARQFFENLFAQDIQTRQHEGISGPYFQNGPAGNTILANQSHLALDVMGRCDVFDQLVERMLESPRVRKVVEAWMGPSFRIDSANIRYMTGEYDPAPAHALHRDGRYVTNLCIMLSDVEPGDNGATAFVAGSHRYHDNPRWDYLFEPPFVFRKDLTKSGLALFLRWNVFNRLLKARCWKNYTGAFGKQGDIYFMANGEVWHGRVPNLHGRRTMICLMGCTAATPEYAAAPQTVPANVVAKLPPRFRQAVGGPFPINASTGSIIDRLWKSRRPAPFFSLEHWAKRERELAEWLSTIIGHQIIPGYWRVRSFLGRGYRYLLRRLGRSY